MEHPLSQEVLPEKVARATSPMLAKEKKMAVAVGAMPMAADENVLALYQLSYDNDKDVARKAGDTLRSMPTAVIAAAVGKLPYPEPIDCVAKLFFSSGEVISAVLQSIATDNESIADIAKFCPTDVAEYISRNQRRLAACPRIIESLYLNKKTRMSTVDRVISFAIRNDIALDGLSAYREIAQVYKIEKKVRPDADAAGPAAPTNEELRADSFFSTAFFSGIDEDNRAEVDDGAEFSAMMQNQGGIFAEFDDGAGGGMGAGIFAEFDDGSQGADMGIFGEFDENLKGRAKGDGEEEEELGGSLEMRISRMSISHKIRLATIGTSQHRMILLNDANKMVALAAIKSPAITDQEVVLCSQSRSVSEEILRFISGNRDYMKNYFVKVNIVSNPKTPLSSAMRYLTHLRKHDLKNVAQNKNIPNSLRTAAKNMIKKTAPR
ncbi:MAG: hypothetical protein ABIJ56_06195 [Pseudomonadota bacterium]